ncbi:NAD(P)-dependent dehydrogenase (short-subunit alcohol dehydrogenase family) [Rhizobium sp. PP-F2F-G48]|uniref:SDR family NAD(P)-dependent oxidoreductase n=1 Tax=Rhizobium sp. PP-F2F-G48 TaxID=2135651 RepID=UPI0010509DEC|nr:SDR family oxidoreductase [Rhizobium sp. PP-F2F-G48]TCM49684.1 NAD(P)-dependent dehydrogenase (short-subunit alcohol dehydrogenase family) [Rhizobium sp. PP-F2F-G48]
MTASDRSVLITGGASGIGLDIAGLLSERGWKIYLIDRDTEALANACRLLSLEPQQLIACSVTDEEAITAAVETACAQVPMRAVVNSAGIAMDRLAVDTGLDDFRRIIDINLTGTFLVCREAARYWQKASIPGAIVNISSVSGILGSRGRSAYGASKGAVNILTHILSTELGPSGIRVNAIAPGAIDTPLARAIHTSDVRAQWHARIPQQRYGTSREIATAVAFLISDDATYVNGQVLAVDGGFSTAGLAVKG